MSRASSVSPICFSSQNVVNSCSYCVGTRRKSILDAEQIAKCREILGSDHATNFETRMVAEVNLYWIIYTHCSKVSVDLPKTQETLHKWKQEWKFLFGRTSIRYSRDGQLMRSRPATIPIHSNGILLCPTFSLRSGSQVSICCC